MDLLKKCHQRLSNLSSKIKIALVEGHSQRMIKAAKQVITSDLMIEPVLIFKTKIQFSEVKEQITSLEYIIMEEHQEKIKSYSNDYFILRQGKETKQEALINMQKPEFFAAMLVYSGELHGALGGVELTTTAILRAAFKVIGPQKGVKTISSAMIMSKDGHNCLFADISVNPQPDFMELGDIAQNTVEFARMFKLPEKVAFLSFSTSGSASSPATELVYKATTSFNKRQYANHEAIGEVQFDTAFDSEVKIAKYKYDFGFSGVASIFIFPDLNSANIGYKIAQRMGGWMAVGPIIVGLKKPYNDLSRGASVSDVVDTLVITATQSLEEKEK